MLDRDTLIGQEFKGAFGGLFVVLFGHPLGHGLESLERSHTLVKPDLSSSAGNAVHGRPKHHHLVEGGDDEVGMVGRAQTGIDRITHRADVHSLLLSAIRQMCLGKIEGVQGVERGSYLVFHELRDLVIA